MKNITIFTLALPLLLLAPAAMSGCATTRTVGERIDDVGVQREVARRLTADPEVKRFQIDVEVVDGVVYLRGEVEDQATADKAEQLAETADGVESVVNQLMIEGDNGREPDARGDLAIRTAVGSRLAADPEVRRFNVDIDVVQGVVHLSGAVRTQAAKDAAERIAAGVDGVVDVRNDLRVADDAEDNERDRDNGDDHGDDHGHDQ